MVNPLRASLPKFSKRILRRGGWKRICFPWPQFTVGAQFSALNFPDFQISGRHKSLTAQYGWLEGGHFRCSLCTFG